MADKLDYIQELRRLLGEVTTMSASEVKNQFGQALESAIRDGAVVITKHDTPKAVLLSIEELERLTEHRALDGMRAEFDAMFARMQTPEDNAAADAAFNASEEELSVAALKAMKKQRRR